MRNVSVTRFAVLLATTVSLSACGAGFRDRNPQVSDITLDSRTMPEATFVSVPMPEAQPARLLHRAEAASLWQNGSSSFFADQRAAMVGDILTIDIQIDDQAQLSNATARSREGGSTLPVPRFFGYAPKLYKVLPGISEGDLPTDNYVDLNSSSGASGSGTIDRAESISLKVAALVVRALPNGNLVIAGRQEVMVNSELRELRVAGIIRPQDIGLNNVIAYDKIAEARITYAGRGQISRQTRTSLGEEAIDIILPY